MKTTAANFTFMWMNFIVIGLMLAYISPDSHAIERGTMSKLVIADKGISNYVIVISEAASPSEKQCSRRVSILLEGDIGRRSPNHYG